MLGLGLPWQSWQINLALIAFESKRSSLFAMIFWITIRIQNSAITRRNKLRLLVAWLRLDFEYSAQQQTLPFSAQRNLCSDLTHPCRHRPKASVGQGQEEGAGKNRNRPRKRRRARFLGIGQQKQNK